jgi:hypothetical protein
VSSSSLPTKGGNAFTWWVTLCMGVSFVGGKLEISVTYQHLWRLFCNTCVLWKSQVWCLGSLHVPRGSRVIEDSFRTQAGAGH